MADPKQAERSAKSTELVKTGEGSPDESKKEGWLSWIVGWVLMPSTVLGVIFGGGVLVGAHLHDSWYARTVEWVVNLF